MPESEHKAFLDMAARAAYRAWGDAEPNPLVGAVLVREGRVLAIGHHRRFGGLHAEREAITRCRHLGHDPRGATLYCTLEPCRHVGKQPPCTDAILEAGIARVVYARPDPADVSGGGHAVLKAAGVACERCADSPAATRLSDPFVHRVRTGRPWVIAKWAQTLDGLLDTRAQGKRWISGPRARARVHRLRSRVDAIVTGIGTVLADDPLLTVRGVRRVRRVPTRVVLDTRFRLPLDSALARTARQEPVLLMGSMDDALTHGAGSRIDALEQLGVEVMGARHAGRPLLERVFEHLWIGRGHASVLLEAGPTLLSAAFKEGLVNEAVVHVQGGDQGRAVDAAESLVPALGADAFERIRAARLGGDVELVYRARVET